MGKLSSLKIACMVLAFCAATAIVSTAQASLSTLVNFDGTNGRGPDGVLTQGTDGNIYGTTGSGGSSENCDFGCGTIFRVTAGTLTTLYSFCAETGCTDGAGPLGPLVQAPNGDFYGTTSAGGAYGGGTVFKITREGTLSTLYSFCALVNCADGERPNGELAQGRNGNFYGTTTVGGAGIDGCSEFFNGCGTVFEITPAGKLTTIYSFCASNPDCPDGDLPAGGLVQANNGQLYGETGYGGTADCGTAFKISPAGRLTTLLSFELGPCGPGGGLIQASNGNFYGIAVGGNGAGCDGSYGCGTVVEITPAGKLTTLYNFCSLPGCADGSFPNGPLVQGTDGNFYGTTETGGAFNPHQGTLFEITPTGALTTLYTFCRLTGCADGAGPGAGLMQDTNGPLYGTTGGGGTSNDGTIFSVAVGLGPFVKTQPTAAKEDNTIGIFGQGFGRSSVVQFGGVQATSVKFSGSTFLTAIVPAGALTGPVTVTTAGTTLASNPEFRVTPQLLSFDPPSGPVGTQVTITGAGFTQTLGVGFGDSVPAEFTVNSDTSVTATVPTGATTGPIGVVTKGGTAISSTTFTVN